MRVNPDITDWAQLCLHPSLSIALFDGKREYKGLNYFFPGAHSCVQWVVCVFGLMFSEGLEGWKEV